MSASTKNIHYMQQYGFLKFWVKFKNFENLAQNDIFRFFFQFYISVWFMSGIPWYRLWEHKNIQNFQNCRNFCHGAEISAIYQIWKKSHFFRFFFQFLGWFIWVCGWFGQKCLQLWKHHRYLSKIFQPHKKI